MSNIDWEFIHKLEGKGLTKGYHPTNNSGVTIASGFDLKEKDADFCRSIGIPETIVSELLPYFGLSGDQAKHFADKLELTEDVIEIIDRCSRSYYAENLISQYNSYDPIQEFDNLDQGQATVIISVGFQYGSFSRTPSFIKYATDGNWDAVYKELQEFGDDFPTRRKKEAEYLKNYGSI